MKEYTRREFIKVGGAALAGTGTTLAVGMIKPPTAEAAGGTLVVTVVRWVFTTIVEAVLAWVAEQVLENVRWDDVKDRAGRVFWELGQWVYLEVRDPRYVG